MVFRQNDLGHSRLGIAIRKTVCNAARRNRLKRWIREVFRKDPLLQGLALDVVVVVKQSGRDLRFDEIQEEFGRLLRKVL